MQPGPAAHPARGKTVGTDTTEVAIQRVADMITSAAILSHFEDHHHFSKPAMARINHKTGFEWRDFEPFEEFEEDGKKFVRIQRHVYRLTPEQFEQAWQRAQEMIARIPSDAGRASQLPAPVGFRGRKPMAPELKKRQISLTLKPETITWLHEQCQDGEVPSQVLDRLAAAARKGLPGGHQGA